MVAWHYTLCPRRVSRDFGTNLLLTIQLKSPSTLSYTIFCCLAGQCVIWASPANYYFYLNNHSITAVTQFIFSSESVWKHCSRWITGPFGFKLETTSHQYRHISYFIGWCPVSLILSNAKCDMSRTGVKKKKLKVSLLPEKGSEGWMTKEMGSGKERGSVRGREGEREREGGERKCGVISCATEPHSRRGRNSR